MSHVLAASISDLGFRVVPTINGRPTVPGSNTLDTGFSILPHHAAWLDLAVKVGVLCGTLDTQCLFRWRIVCVSMRRGVPAAVLDVETQWPLPTTLTSDGGARRYYRVREDSPVWDGSITGNEIGISADLVGQRGVVVESGNLDGDLNDVAELPQGWIEHVRERRARFVEARTEADRAARLKMAAKRLPA